MKAIRLLLRLENQVLRGLSLNVMRMKNASEGNDEQICKNRTINLPNHDLIMISTEHMFL